MIDEIKKDASERMDKSISSLQQSLTKLRTGRAHTSLLDHITVEYYGSQVPLNQVANVNVDDSRTLAVSPWEKTMVQPIEKAIMKSDLGLNPVTAGTTIRVPLPPLTEERRKDMIKLVRHEAEGGRIAIRNIRRDALSDIKDLLKEKMIGEDEEHRAHDEVQLITDKHIASIDKVLATKESELMEI
ncbi:MAG: ribosome recycling factor [Gammaproteobacteria bacterium]|nr:MAG: ribosome recycling factor [Gammaproteobacteria bacterium]RLA37295.1 MAG: ribosome recycling factor [Gammaproteobacteria bacterium]